MPIWVKQALVGGIIYGLCLSLLPSSLHVVGYVLVCLFIVPGLFDDEE